MGQVLLVYDKEKSRIYLIPIMDGEPHPDKALEFTVQQWCTFMGQAYTWTMATIIPDVGWSLGEGDPGVHGS